MPPHARLLALIATLTIAFGTSHVTPASAAAGTAADDTTLAAPEADVVRPIMGETFRLNGSVGTGQSREVLLQHFQHGEWQTVQRQEVADSGRYSFVVTQPSWRSRWRVLAPAVEGPGSAGAELVSTPRTLFGQGQNVTTSVQRSVRAGGTVRITLFASPARPGRQLTLQRNSGDGWKKVTDLRADATGHARHVFKTADVAKTRFRTVARAHRGAPQFIGRAAAVYALGKKPVGVMAWRGDSANYPENTLEAYRSAVRHRADFIEMDFQPTADGEWVLLHDSDFRRTTDVEERFPERRTDSPREFTLEEVRSLDAGSWMGTEFEGSRVPTIEEAFDAIEAAERRYRHRVRLVIELKGESAAEMQALYRKVVGLRPTWVSKKGHDDKALFMSFEARHFDFPGVERTGMEKIAVKDEPDPADDYRRPYAQVHIHTRLLDAEHVDRFHRRKAKVGTWPAVGTAAVLRAAVAGVDFVTTDDVAGARRALLR
ncbi:glycerophosphoryl diester phosphodiesterase [Nocardioides luteus]|uniref:glycerophosphodiester phosphodiesterase n=1 Tax=Nocardioides luteus TaxID=1844 RepID=UPI001669C61A|nr:glycerophosphodiester phosphodiesterase family protein [Nocardioides luteus]MDR7310738.1 glycerophosphoryl diester phosphodiesterase [Nocardioides luteus]